MASRTEYNACMVPYMTGGGPERKNRFCLGAKLCSGKATTEEEATKLCAEATFNPKPSKAKKSKRGNLNISTLASCVINGLDGSQPTIANLNTILTNCTGQKVEKTGREKFIKSCFKENTTGDGFQYDIKEAQKLRSFCIAKWKEQEAAL